MEHDRDLVTVRSFSSEQEAHLLKSMLNEHGVPAVVAGMTSFDGLSVIDAVTLNVRKIDEQLAQRLLEDFEQNQRQVPAWTCTCGADVDEGFDQCWRCQSPHPDFDEPTQEAD